MSRALLLSAALSCQSPAPPEEVDLGELETRMAELVNVEREARGLAPLAFSSALADVGREYSAKMADATLGDKLPSATGTIAKEPVSARSKAKTAKRHNVAAWVATR